ncbi:MAG: RHS repeat-associated core domain-containing protein, partial [Candidatus Hermodarchaeota archaeon]
GNAIHNRRQLVSNYKKQVDWSESPESQLENEVFTSQAIYDALNRLIRIIPPHNNKDGTTYNVVQPVYNEANLLERIDIWLELENESNILHIPDSVPQHFVKNINYNAKGQRIMVEYGNRVKTEYKYDNQTYRLTHLFTTRKKNGLFSADCSNPNPCENPSKTCPKPRNFPCGLQNLHYTYDPVGNITSIRDNAQYKIFFRGDLVKPENEYTYDAIYRLIASHGREHLGQITQPETTWDDKSRINREHPNDFRRMRNYNEYYEYDNVGNIIKIDHKAGNGNWIRKYEYNEESLIENDKKNNRLSETILHPDRPNPIIKPYSYDSNGNTVLMSHFAAHNDQENKENMHWDFEDQLQKVDLRGGGIVYYFYDASGNRIRKIHEHDGDLVEERIYLENFEIYRKKTVNGLVLERETLHILDGDRRVAIVETRTIDTQNNDPTPRQLIRYQHNNHLGTAKLELDDNSKIISYEEYYPYGGTSYQGVTRILEVPFKRYRFTGKERDEETGFYYYGKRYYIPWLGRWISVDPIGEDDHTNLYVAMRNNPIVFHDTHGLYSESGHYYTVYFVSLAAGFSPETAFRNAFFAQMPDEVKEMDATKTQVSNLTSPLAEAKSKFTGLIGRLRAKAAGSPFASEGDGIIRLANLAFRDVMQKGLHVLTGGKAQEETNFRIQEIKKLTPGTPKFGFNLHAFGDSYSHRRLDNPKLLYKTGMGHGHDLTKPDKIHERPNLYNEYVTTLFQTLSGLSSQGKKITDKELAAFINAMTNETTEEGKISIIHKLAAKQFGVKLNPFTPEEDSNLEFSDFKKKYPIVDFKLPSVFEIAEEWARRPRSTPIP